MKPITLKAKSKDLTGSCLRIPIQVYDNESGAHRYREIKGSATRIEIPEGVSIEKVVSAIQGALQEITVK
jgi:hypothetical protein